MDSNNKFKGRLRKNYFNLQKSRKIILKLTIGIPTYNGSNRIRETLDSILWQIDEKLVSDIEILVADNGSIDETKSIIDSYKKNAAISIKYIRHENNIGFDRNVDSLFHNASGDYVWTLADDDTLQPNALKRVIESVEKDLLNVILVNFIAFDSNMKSVRDAVPLSRDVIYSDPEAFLKDAKSKYSLLSSLIFNKKAWLNTNIEPGIGSNFIHVYSLLNILPKGLSKIISEPLINYRQGSENFGTSTESVLNISFSACHVILSMKTMGYKKSIISWLLRQSENYIHQLVINLKLEGIESRQKIIKNLLALYPTPRTIFKIIPILYIPDNLFKDIYFRKKKLSKILKFNRSNGDKS